MSRRPTRQVHFEEPVRSLQELPMPPSILRVPPPMSRQSNPFTSDSLSQPVRRQSLPDMRDPGCAHNIQDPLALEALHDLRAYLKEACNFHGDDSRRALSVLSARSLCALVDFRTQKTNDINRRITRGLEAVLRSTRLNPEARHPHHELSLPDRKYTSAYEKNARVAARKRSRREAEFRLMEFVSRQLRITLHVLRDMRFSMREQCELDAFKKRLERFHPSRISTNTAASYVPRSYSGSNPLLSSTSGYSSVQQSPVGRPVTAPHSPSTDPLQHARAMYMPGGEGMGDGFPPMEELSLKSSVYEMGKGIGAPVANLAPSLAPTPQQAQRTSPYNAHPSHSPYVSPAVPMQMYAPAVSTGHAVGTPQQMYAHFPVAGHMYTGAHQAYAATAPSPGAAYPCTPPQPPILYTHPHVFSQSTQSPYQQAIPPQTHMGMSVWPLPGAVPLGAAHGAVPQNVVHHEHSPGNQQRVQRQTPPTHYRR